MKKVLLLAPPFFGYHEAMANEMRRRGLKVDWMNDRPSNGVAFKSLSKISYELVQPLINRYFKIILDKAMSGKYDTIFSLGGMSWCFSPGQTSELKDRTGATLILYLWDSLKNCQRAGDSFPFFDMVFSFDPFDCKENGFTFLPLFYSFNPNQYLDTSEFLYDACFIGSVHQVSKFHKVKSIVDRLEAEGARVFKHFYIPSNSVATLRRAQYPAYRQVELTTRSLSSGETAAVYSASRTLVDSPQSGQRGLTMRTIESIGMNRRLITTNECVREYDFFPYENVLVDDGSADFMRATSDPLPYPDDLKERYSIRSWVGKIIESVEAS